MKHIKLVLVLVLFAFAFSVPALAGSHASADNFNNGGTLKCYYEEDPSSDGCDLALTKLVEVNNGGFVSAETSNAAAQAEVGDTVTWQVTITNNSVEGWTPYGTVTVQDILPSGFTNVSSVTSTGTFTDNDWTFDVNDTLPATLTVTSTASTAGLFENTATLTGYTCNTDQVDPPYADADPSNNSDSAYVNVTAVPVAATPTPTPAATVTTTSSVGTPNTGFAVNNTSAVESVYTICDCCTWRHRYSNCD